MRRSRGTSLVGAILRMAFLSLTAAGTAFAQTEAHRETIDDTYREWVDATNARDLDRWTAYLAPEPLFLPPNHPALRGESEIRDFYERLFADSRFSLICHQERVEVAEAKDIAWSMGNCEVTFTGPDGNAATDSSKWAKVWVRLPNGDWRCSLNSWSSNGPGESGNQGPAIRAWPPSPTGRER